MNLFDLHCDTATEAFDKNKPLSAFSLPLLKTPYQKWAQTFAIYISDTKKEDAKTYFEGAFEYLKTELTHYPNVTPIFAVENCGNMIKDSNKDIKMLKDRGVRIVSLTHNSDNPLCGGIRGDGHGLSALGKGVVSELAANRITLDCSHCSDQAFWDICDATDKTFIATHSNSRSVCGDMRNLTDEQVKEIFKRGGIVGLNFYGEFLGEKSPVEALIAHIGRFFELGGESGVAIGSDYDGATIAKELFDLKKVEKRIAKAFGQKAADGIFYENAARFFGMDEKAGQYLISSLPF